MSIPQFCYHCNAQPGYLHAANCPGPMYREPTKPKPTKPKRESKRFPVVCLECGKKFLTASMDPRCPKCNGVDIEPQ
jgi:hypothetical protein